MSVCGAAWQQRIRPATSSSWLSAFCWCAPWMTRPFEHAALARAAGAVAAAVGQADALADGGLQDGLVALDAEGLAARLDGDGERHGGGRERRGARRLDSARDFARLPRAPGRTGQRWRTRQPTFSTVPDRSTRFKRPVLLIVGCGDVGLRVVRLLAGRWRVLALTSSAGARRRAARRRRRAAARRPRRRRRRWPASPASPMPCFTSRRRRRAARGDPRTRHLVAALARSPRLRRFVYGSTSGVYGDRGGALTDETAPLRAGHRTGAAPRRCREPAAPLRPRQRRRRDPAAHSRHLRARPRRRRPARARRARHAGARRRRRRPHQPHPRRRPGARLRRRAAPRPAAARRQRRRRQRAEDGRLLRSRRRSLRPGAAASPGARRSRRAAVAAADELSRRVAAPRQRAAQGRASPRPALPDGRRGPRRRPRGAPRG